MSCENCPCQKCRRERSEGGLGREQRRGVFDGATEKCSPVSENCALPPESGTCARSSIAPHHTVVTTILFWDPRTGKVEPRLWPWELFE